MNVCVEILFDPVDDDAWDSMRSFGRDVTNDRDSVRVFVPERARLRRKAERRKKAGRARTETRAKAE